MINNTIYKVVIVGPESTGKSMLTEQLSSYFKACKVLEYARTYLTVHGTQYHYNTLETIAKGQLTLEQEAIQHCTSNLIIADTDMYVMKVWCEFVFGKCHHFILHELSNNNADLYLLTRPNIPWVKDALREYPDEETRWKLFYYYKDILVNTNIPFVEINAATFEDRNAQAIAALKKHNMLLST
jgi:NadR type nicotinamide-nucleotide adenylyltransferase